jgi:predicted Rossmann fold nucleotide-binding protein DprA/Smf involved in DNA uptake
LHQRIVAILDDGPAHLDTIITASDIPAPQIMAALTHMELTGSVTSMLNGYWRKA